MPSTFNYDQIDWMNHCTYCLRSSEKKHRKLCPARLSHNSIEFKEYQLGWDHGQAGRCRVSANKYYVFGHKRGQEYTQRRRIVWLHC